MAKKRKGTTLFPVTPKDHVLQLIEWMSQGVYEKEQIIAVALLCAVAGENMFLLGPPGTAKSMVAARLKSVFKDGKSFDYLMSRFSTPDEIFGPISISKLKNEDRYERLTSGYLPEADVVFLDEIWKAGPSIQNTLLTVINEHLFHNGTQTIRTPMKVLIAASNELPAKDEGLEALWDRFLMRMISNCISSDTAFFKMIQSSYSNISDLPDALFITNELYNSWQQESRKIGMQSTVISAIKALRKSMASLEKEDGNHLRYYISDRRWRKAYSLMQTSAFLNGRTEIDTTDYLLLIHSFWNDVECIPNVLNAFTASLTDHVEKAMGKIDKQIRQMISSDKQEESLSAPASPQKNETNFAEYDYFYYLIENYQSAEPVDTYFSKWDYPYLSSQPRDGVIYYDTKRKKNIVHSLIQGRPFDAKSQNANKLSKVKLQKCPNGIIIDGTPYAFRKKGGSLTVSMPESGTPIYQRIAEVQTLFATTVSDWGERIRDTWSNCKNIFIGANELALVNKKIAEVEELINATQVKINNLIMMIK